MHVFVRARMALLRFMTQFVVRSFCGVSISVLTSPTLSGLCNIEVEPLREEFGNFGFRGVVGLGFRGLGV